MTPVTTHATPTAPRGDPLPVARGLLALRRLVGLYPPGHPLIGERLDELERIVLSDLADGASVQVDVIHGQLHLGAVPHPEDGRGQSEVARELRDLGVDSLELQPGVDRSELAALAEFLWSSREGFGGRPVADQLLERGIRHVVLGRIVPLDTRWRMKRWQDAPSGPLDPAYEESLAMAQQTFTDVAAGRALDPATVRDLVRLLIHQVAHSSAALAQILAVKQYENLTYCHSVNVAMLSLLLGKQLGLDEATTATLVECGLLHDLGKTRVPLEVVQKPGALDRRERALIEAHTTFGAELLLQAEGVHPLAPTVALEHHRHLTGKGYPDLGEGHLPHAMSQIVSVADVYEALTGARSYKEPHPPERAMLILARIAGDQLNAHLVKAFISAVSFFPVGSLVRTTDGRLGVVVRTHAADPLHPVLALRREDGSPTGEELDTARRDDAGRYLVHVVESLAAPG